MLTIFTLIVLLFSLVIHEVSHGRVALALGDPTAKNEGRLSLNPLNHLDPLGSVLIPLLLFLAGSPILIGWAKPVPINPYNFRDRKWGILKVALAGPAINFILAIIMLLLARFFTVGSMFFNLLSVIAILNLRLCFFNLIPVPPLDGSQILLSILSEKFHELKSFLYQYGQFLLLLFIFFGFGFLDTIVFWVYRLLVG